MAEYGNGKLLFNHDNFVLHTGLSEREAAHIKLMQSLNEEGTIIAKQKDGSFAFSAYTFNNSYTAIELGSKTETVFVSGPAINGVPFFDLLKPQSKKQALEVLNMLSEAVEYAFNNKISLPNTGPLGTIVLEDGSLLILPYTIFNRSMLVGSDTEYSKFVGCFKNEALAEIDSWRFTLSVYAYFLLSEKLPFTNTDTSLRKIDYSDFNFIPLEWLIKFNDETENQNIDKILKIISNNLAVAAPETVKKSKRNKYAKPKSISLPSLKDFGKPEFLPLEENAQFNKQTKKLKFKRFLRKHSTAIKITSITVAILAIILCVTIFDKKDSATTKGKTPLEVVQMFYKAFDELNVESFNATVTKGTAESYEAMITNIFVTSRVRETYENDKVTYTTEQWLNVSEPWSRWVFGLTNVDIQNLTESEDGKTATAEASYYIVWTEAGNEVFCTKTTDNLQLVYKKDRWKINALESAQTEVFVDSNQFFKELQTIVANTEIVPTLQNNSAETKINFEATQALAIIRELKDDYEWLPTEEQAIDGNDSLIEKYKETMLFIR